jgi:hypothetical protein
MSQILFRSSLFTIFSVIICVTGLVSFICQMKRLGFLYVNENLFVGKLLFTPNATEMIEGQDKVHQIKDYGEIPLHFEPNVGQVAASTKFTTRGSGYQVLLAATETTLVLKKYPSNLFNFKKQKQNTKPEFAEDSVVKMRLIGAKNSAKAMGTNELEGKSNYFIGNDKTKWQTDVPNFGRVRFAEIYPGVDLEYYGNQRRLEYDFLVKPKANPASIRLQFDGVINLSVSSEGELILNTKAGELRQKKPVIYQQENGERREIRGGYKLKNGTVGFWIGDYDNEKTLVIDPVIVYATYHGGTGADSGNAVTVDGSGSAYIVGNTSGSFPVTTSQIYGGGASDIFISKLNSLGSGFIYSTYLGGNQTDSGKGIAVDGQGNVYITGQTNSTNFPRSQNPRQNIYGGGASDAFAAKLNATGNALVYSTFHGGFGADDGRDIAVDTNGQAYLTGETSSNSDFPTLFARQINYGGGASDAFISKLNAAGNQFIFSTYHGGNQTDTGRGITVDSPNNIFVVGHTASSDFPTNNAVQGEYGGGASDAFVTKLSADGQNLIYSTFHGGSLGDYGYDIAVNNSDSAFITGETNSVTNFPILFAYQPIFGGGVGDAFVTGFSSFGGRTYSTFLGGTGYEYGFGVATDRTGKVYVTGGTDSPNFPKVNAQQRIFGGVHDAYITVFDLNNNKLFYSSYYGGSASDSGQAIAVDIANNIYVSGATASNNISPTTAPQRNYGGGASDGFILKFNTLAPTYINVSGRVTNPNNEPVSAVIRAAGDDSAQTFSSFSDGLYTLSLPQNGNYLISPVGLLNHTFTPTNHPVTGLNSPQTGKDFTVRTNNDNFSQAIEITGASGELNTENDAATRETGEPDHGDKTIWYKWRATSATRVNFRLVGNNNTRISVYTGSALNNLSTAGTRHSANSVTIIPTVNTEYKIAIAGGGSSHKLKWGNFVTISGFAGSSNSPALNEIIIQAVSRTTPPITYEVRIPGSGGYYEIQVPPGNTYDLAPVNPGGLNWNPPSRVLSNLTADSPNNDFTYSVTLARNVSGTTGIGTDISPAPIVTYSGPGTGNCTINSFGDEHRYTCPSFPNGTVISISALHLQYTFSPNSVQIPLTSNVTYNFNAIRNNCNYSFSPASPRSVPVSGGDFSVAVTTNTSCPLSVRSNDNWITFNGLSGNSVLYNVAINDREQSRSGSLTIGGITYTIIQASILPRLSVADVYRVEGNNGTTDYIFTVALSAASTQTVRVKYSTVDNTATAANQDFAAVLNQEIEFAPGQIIRQLTVQVKGDLSFEPNENFNLVLFDPQNATLGNSIGVGVIENDDQNTAPRKLYDFDGDGRSDIGVFRPSDGGWYLLRSQAGFTATQFGIATDKAVAGDFDGDGKADIAVFRSGNWFWLNSSNGAFNAVQFGAAGDQPMAGDFDGDGKNDPTVFRNGVWYILQSSDGAFRGVQFGTAGDKPVAGDYDGDNKSDIAVFRPTDGGWYVLGSQVGFTAVQFGIATDAPAPADFDGDGKTDVAVFRAGIWYLLRSQLGFTATQFGAVGDAPAPADYDGDNKSDIAVFRPSNGTWYQLGSTSGFSGVQFGANGDTAVSAPLY